MVPLARMAAFRFTALDDPVLTEKVRRHIGARRFAYNRCLEAVKDGLEERRARPDTEDPAVKNMVKNHHLARSINDAAWGELASQLRYKAD
jgi:transposase